MATLSAKALCSLGQLKWYLNILDDHKDEILADFIEDASQRIIESIGYDPRTQTYTDEVYDGPGDYQIVTRARPVTAITTIKEWDGDTWTAIDATDVAQMVDRDWYIDGHDYKFVSGRSVYKVTYTAGLGDTVCERAFAVPCMKIAAWLDREAGVGGMLGISSMSTEGGGSRTIMEDAIGSILLDLSPYRRLS